MNNLRNFRKRYGLTQKDLARILFVSQSLISMYETGSRRPSVSVVDRLFRLIDVNVIDLRNRIAEDLVLKLEIKEKTGK